MAPQSEADNNGGSRTYDPETGMTTHVCTNNPPGSCTGIQLLHCAACNEQQGSTASGATSTEGNVARFSCTECRQGGRCARAAEGERCAYEGTCACLEACTCSNVGNWIAHNYAGQPEIARVAREAAGVRQRAAREAGRNAERQGICTECRNGGGCMEAAEGRACAFVGTCGECRNYRTCSGAAAGGPCSSEEPTTQRTEAVEGLDAAGGTVAQIEVP